MIAVAKIIAQLKIDIKAGDTALATVDWLPTKMDEKDLEKLSKRLPCCLIGYGGLKPVSRDQSGGGVIKQQGFHFLIIARSARTEEDAESEVIARLDTLRGLLDGAQLTIEGEKPITFSLLAETPEHTGDGLAVYSAIYTINQI
jgi:hypothetical protein